MMGRLRGGVFDFDIIGHAKRWFIVSGVILVLSAGSLLIRQVNPGIEFRGGTAFQVEAVHEVTTDEMREALAALELTDVVVQRVGDRGFLVQTPHLGSALQSVGAGLVAETAGVGVEEVTVTDVGPRWGRQITSRALQAFVLFLVVAVIYISIRLEPKMAGVSIVTLLHDLVITAGIYSMSGFVVTPATVIALLTILGYSLYDTVVIFDRVKERTRSLSAGSGVSYSGAANQALNQVLIRSLNTSVTSLLPIGSLLFVGSFLLGAETLRELALALLIGLSVGTYSSIFVAAPLLARWKEREARWTTLRARIAAHGSAKGSAEGREPVAVAPGSGTQVRPPRKRGKKKRKRR